jgi:hypothetical protein
VKLPSIKHPHGNELLHRSVDLLPHRRSPPLAELVTLGLLLVDTVGQELGVVVAGKRLVKCSVKHEDMISVERKLTQPRGRPQRHGA